MWQLVSTLDRLTLAATVAAAAAFIINIPLDRAEADGQWGPYGNYGQTYQNHHASECRWYDLDPRPPHDCYMGIWSDLTGGAGDNLMIVEYGYRHGNLCIPYPDDCDYGYFAFNNPVNATGVNFAETGGIHYYCGEYSCSYEVNVRGFARHYNMTLDPYTWFTTSHGYPPSPVDPSEY